MKKAGWILISIFFIVLWVGCGEDTTQNDTDRIEQVGDAASAIGYDGEKIKEDLREVNKLKEMQDKKLQEVMDQ